MQAYKDNGEIVLSYKYQSLIEVNARKKGQKKMKYYIVYQSLIEVNASSSAKNTPRKI